MSALELIKTMSEEELDVVAVHKNSVIATFPKDVIDEDNLEDISHLRVGSWGIRWISTSDPERKMMLILKPNDRRTKQLTVVGRVVWLMIEFSLDYENSVHLVRGMWGVKHANVKETLQLVVNALKSGSLKIESLDEVTSGGNRIIAELILHHCILAKSGDLDAPGFPYTVYKEWIEKS